MIVVDSSVWIGYFRGSVTKQTEMLDHLLESELLAVGDSILLEVLQGLADEGDFEAARRVLSRLIVVELGGPEMAIQAARHYRTLRRLGVTVRKTIDCLIATCCIQRGYRLLHNDRDFDVYAKHLGLDVVA